MPTNRTRKPGAMTSRMRLFFAARRSARLGRPVDVAARLLVGLELDEILLFRILEEVGEGPIAIVGLVEAGIAALQCLFHTRPSPPRGCRAAGRALPASCPRPTRRAPLPCVFSLRGASARRRAPGRRS